MAKHSSHILEMARKGAEHRYEELKAEVAALMKHFPHLTGRPGGHVSRTVSKGGKAVAEEGPIRRRRRKPMSAATKKAVSDRMKTYWAKRRAAKGHAK